MEDLHADILPLQEMADDFNVEFCCFSWKSSSGHWHRVSNSKELLATIDVSFTTLFKSMKGREATVIEDLKANTRFGNDSLVRGTPALRFYAEVPVKAIDGGFIGTVAIADSTTREASAMNFPGKWAKQFEFMLLAAGFDRGFRDDVASVCSTTFILSEWDDRTSTTASRAATSEVQAAQLTPHPRVNLRTSFFTFSTEDEGNHRDIPEVDQESQEEGEDSASVDDTPLFPPQIPRELTLARLFTTQVSLREDTSELPDVPPPAPRELTLARNHRAQQRWPHHEYFRTMSTLSSLGECDSTEERLRQISSISQCSFADSFFEQ
jgi:hypothetical protein